MIVSTFNSIYMQMHPFDELIVVDSSSSDNIKAFVAAEVQRRLVSYMSLFRQVEYMMRKITVFYLRTMIGFALLILAIFF